MAHDVTLVDAPSAQPELVEPVTVSTTAQRLARRANEQRRYGEGWLDQLFVPAVLLGLLLYLGWSAHGFLTSDNLVTILLQGSILAFVSFGMTFVILAGELDLSVGSGVALVSVVSALAMRDSGSIELGILAGLGTGLALGLVNGAVVTRLHIPSFIATLGTLTIAQGIALSLTNGAVIGQLPTGIGDLANGTFLGIRWLVWLLAVVFVMLYLLHSRTTFGVRVMSVGANREAARLSGVKVDRVRLVCFVISGFCVGLAGITLTSRVQSGQPNAGTLLALYAVAAVVVGGTRISGGRGSLSRTLWGVLLLSVLDNGLDVKGLDPDAKQVIIGGVFIAAASVDFIRRRIRWRRAEGGAGEGGRTESEPGTEGRAAPSPEARPT